ncbi:MAG: helix-turn-helix transcriptional regulator [Clostridia bacterium]|nr:helix-turn-helix transcriptional regulator [Clostridia bacterium]
MENTREINEKIAKNLTYYRKNAGLTQAELAEKINYSDKSVSKWESAGGVPDIYILLELAKLYGVTLNDLVGDEPTPMPQSTREKKKRTGSRLLIMLLSSGIVWLAATCIFVLAQLVNPSGANWLAFLYAVLANAIVMIVYTGIWKYRLLNFFSVSALVWVAITCVYCTMRELAIFFGFAYDALWCLFLIGIPLQVLEIFWVFFRSVFKKNGEKKRKKTETVEKV